MKYKWYWKSIYKGKCAPILVDLEHNHVFSGFTALCEKYAESDDKHTNGDRVASRGVDALTASLNDYLGRIVQGNTGLLVILYIL